MKEINRFSTEDTERVLVCITAQSNSKRLINKGAQIADERNGELHILHVQKGNSIFNNDQTPLLLQQLFQYGSEKGGMIHAYCDDNIPESIADFIRKEKITRLVLGEPPNQAVDKNCNENQFDKIIHSMPEGITITIVGRDMDKEYIVQHDKVVANM